MQCKSLLSGGNIFRRPFSDSFQRYRKSSTLTTPIGNHKGMLELDIIISIITQCDLGSVLASVVSAGNVPKRRLKC